MSVLWVAIRGADHPFVLPKAPMTAHQPLSGSSTFPLVSSILFWWKYYEAYTITEKICHWLTVHNSHVCVLLWVLATFLSWKLEEEFFFSACALCSLILHSNHFCWGETQMIMESHILLDRPCLAPSLPGLQASPCPWYMSGTPEFYNSYGPSWIMLYRTKEMVVRSFFSFWIMIGTSWFALLP